MTFTVVKDESTTANDSIFCNAFPLSHQHRFLRLKGDVLRYEFVHFNRFVFLDLPLFQAWYQKEIKEKHQPYEPRIINGKRKWGVRISLHQLWSEMPAGSMCVVSGINPSDSDSTFPVLDDIPF